MGVGGLFTRLAQSSGEWPGSSRTFFEGRFDGANVEVEGGMIRDEGAREFEGGVRRIEAAEGGGWRVVGNFGSGRSKELLADGRGGGGMREFD